VRSRVAAGATRSTNAVSRRLHLGQGTVAGGRVGLALDPGLERRLAAGRRIALVSGTNGKTTTTRLLAEALRRDGAAEVITNATGSNMPAGHVAALAAGLPGAPAVLEVDEGYLARVVASVDPGVVVLLNLSRDQLDRTNEVRMLAGRWRQGLARAEESVVVANADDPLVVWGAGAARRVVWVAAGLGWRADATGCPSCEGRIVFGETVGVTGRGAGEPRGATGSAATSVMGPSARSGAGAQAPGSSSAVEHDGGAWSCACGFARPTPALWLEDTDAGPEAVWADGRRRPVTLALPGRFNAANALLATAAAEQLGVAPALALEAMAGVDQVAGRFTTPEIAGVPTRLLLAKNPAGWAELLGMICPGDSPVVVGINARVADGRDPSWLWDVPFEVLRGRPVVASGERCLDLSVRLQYADVAHTTTRDLVEAVRAAARLGGIRARGAGGPSGGRVEFVGNYTAFGDVLGRR
jgi:UDP-N-acetylmuramyl tripeptide synthase